MKFGLLLPHFGEHADPGKLVGGFQTRRRARLRLGVGPRPLGLRAARRDREARSDLLRGPDRAHRDRCGHRTHGTRHRVLIPFRHPLVTALWRAPSLRWWVPGSSSVWARALRPRVRGHRVRRRAPVELVDPTPRCCAACSPSPLDCTNRTSPSPLHGRAPAARGPVPFWYCGGTPRRRGWPRNSRRIDARPDRVRHDGQTSGPPRGTGRGDGQPMPTVGVIPPTASTGPARRPSRASTCRACWPGPTGRSGSSRRQAVSRRSTTSKDS